MRRLIRPLVWVVLIAIMGGSVWFYFHRRKVKQNAVEYRTATIERRDVVMSVTAVGVLEPLTTVEVKANVAGEVVELAVDRGDFVSVGDLIARIDPTETRSAYEEAKAELDAAMAQVSETATELRRQKRVTPAQIRAAEEAVETAEARIRQAESALDYQRHSTEASIRRAEEALAAAQARFRQAQTRAEAQPALTQASVSQAMAEKRSAEQALRRLQEATHPQERTAAKAALEAAKLALENDRKGLSRLEQLRDKGFVAGQSVEEAQTQVATSQERYETAKATYDALQEKQRTELEEAQARVEQANAALAAAQSGEADVRVAQQERNAAEAAVREAQAALEAARAGKAQDEQRQRELEAAKAAAEEARSQVRVARANELQPEVIAQQVKQAQAQARRTQAQLANAAKNLAYTTIVAPRSGLVLDRYIEEGTVISSGRSMVGEGPSLITIADISRMFLLAEVDEADIGQVRVGQPVELEVETFRGETFRGRVTQIYPKGEEVENVTIFRVRIEVQDKRGLLRPGMTAEASIIIDQVSNVLACPNEALFEQQGQSFVEVLEGGKPVQTPIEVGLEGFEWTEIKSGLREGQEVVIGILGGAGQGPGGGPDRGGQRPGGDRRQQMQRMMRMGGERGR
ncbi:MAG: efflux RND transporter periplasmic adaptor subunit [Candidatus Zipacnadales bacterium]